VGLSSAEIGGFSDSQVALLQTFAEQAVIAITSAETYRELQARTRDLEESLEYQTATSDVLKVISGSSFDLQPVFDTIVATAARLCGSDAASISMREGESYRYVARSRLDDEHWAALSQRTTGPGRQSLVGRVALEGGVVQIADIAADSDFAVSESVAAGTRTVLGVPFLREGAVVGTINMIRRRVEPFTDRQIELVRTFADQAVIAIENTRLLTELRESLEQQTATAEVLQVINSSPGELQPVFEAMLERAMRLCEAAFGLMHTFDGTALHLVARRGIPPRFAEFAANPVNQPGPGGATPRLIRDQTLRYVHIIDLKEEEAYRSGDPYRRALVDIGGARTLLAVPLRKDGAMVGVINIYRQEVRAYTEKQIALLENFAAQAVIAIENARLLSELQTRTRDLEESLEYQTATSDVLKVISRSTADVQPVLDTVVETAARLCGADSGSIAVREGEVYRYVAAAQAKLADPVWWATLRQRTIVPGRDTVAGRVALEGKVVHVADVRAIPDYALPETVKAGRRTILGVPLLREGETIGVITLNRQRVEPFTERQIELVRTFADQAVIAIENARLLTELRESLEQQTATAEVLQVINSSPGELQPVFEAILDKAHSLCEASFGGLWTYDSEHFDFKLGRGISEPLRTFVERNSPGPGTGFARIAAGENLVHIVDAPTHGLSHSEFAQAFIQLGGARTVIVVALRKDDKLLGAITAFRQEVRPFSDKEIALLQNFATQAVIAMENARLLGELQARTRELEESLEYQTATSDVLKVIARSTSDVQPVLDTVMETAARLCAADVANITIREGEAYRHVASTFSTADPEYWAIQRERRIVPGRGSLAGRVALEGKVVHVADARADPDYAFPEAIAAGIRTGLGVPLLREGAVLGTINLSRKRVEPYTEQQIELVRTFADQAVIAIENARLLGELQIRTGDLEESLEYQTATSDVLKVISRSAFDLQPILDTLVETGQRLCDSDSAALTIREGDVFRYVATRSLDPAFDAFLRARTFAPGRETVAGRVALTGEVVHIPDITTDPDYRLPEMATIGKNRTTLGVPLLRDGLVVGTLGLNRQRVEPYTERQVELVRTFADQAVIAMENTRLLTELRESLEQQTATAEVLQVINSSPGELQPVFEAILEKAHTHCGATRGTLHLFDGETFRPVAMRGYPQDWAEQLRRRGGFSIRQATHWEPLLAGAPFVHIADLRLVDDPVARAAAERAGGSRTSLQLPLRKDGALLGVISCNRGEVRPFSEKEIAFLENFAAPAVIAMDNARLLEEIRRRQAELRVTFDNMGDGVAMFDAELRLAAWNRNFQQMLDLPDALLAARPSLADYIRHLVTHGEYGEVDVEAEVRRLIEAAGTQYSTERTRPDGRVIDVRVNPVPGGGIVVIYSDVTERKRAEEEIRAARDTAEKALHDLQAAQASLVQAEKMASLGQLTAGIAHEIKNPLNFVNNFAGLSVELLDELKETAAPALAQLEAEQRADIDEVVGMLTGNLEKIAEHGRRADGIVKSMLEHSRGASGERREVDVNGLVEEALNLAYHGARAQDASFNIILERDLDPAVAPIELAPQEMTRVLLNLFGNGFYAATKRQRNSADPDFRPALKVTTRELGEAVEIRVRDNGTGIPLDIRDKLFQPFFTTKPTGEGTGLGLSISWDIVTQQHGGTIAVDSQPGEFTEFTIKLPRNSQAAGSSI
jgi:PAS domain S-box-containing protein